MTNKPKGRMRATDIDAHLKRAFDALADESMPDRFSSLLERLRAGEVAPSGAETATERQSEQATGQTDK